MIMTKLLWFYVVAPLGLIVLTVLVTTFAWWAFTAPHKEIADEDDWGFRLLVRCFATFCLLATITLDLASFEAIYHSSDRPRLSIEPVTKKEAKP
jgi:hypothetical protein